MAGVAERLKEIHSLKEAGILSDEEYAAKKAELMKLPVMLVVGDQEAQAGTVNVRWRRATTKGEAVAVDASAIAASPGKA